MTRQRYMKLVRAYLVTVANKMDDPTCRKALNKEVYKTAPFGFDGVSYATSIDPLRAWIRIKLKARV